MCVAHLYFIIVDAIQKHEKAYEQNKSKSRRHNIEVYALINNTGKYVTCDICEQKKPKADDSTILSTVHKYHYQLLQKIVNIMYGKTCW